MENNENDDLSYFENLYNSESEEIPKEFRHRLCLMIFGERDYSNFRQVLCRGQLAYDLGTVFWMFSQHPQTDEIVSLTATHSLGELKYRLLGFPLKTPERLQKKSPHTICYVILFEKGLSVDFVVNQVDKIKNRIPLGSVEDRVSWSAELFKRLHG